jgi:serine/threonine protein phosphatase PrpC
VANSIEDTLLVEDIHPRYVSAGITDPGHIRSSNQDAFLERTDIGLWVVADGMGGYRDGDVASRMVCDSCTNLEGGKALEQMIDEVRRRMSEVNRQLYAASIRPVNPVVSGSTVAVLVAQGTSCAVLWAGDSRVYRLRRRRLTQLTVDHTRAAQLQLRGFPAEDADHVITRAVGGEDNLVLDLHRDRVRLRDRYLICSDGLTHELPDERIVRLLAEGDAQECAQGLIDATLRTEAHDNVTCVVIDVV